MFGFLKSKEFKSVSKILENGHFFSKDFGTFKIDEICLSLIRKKQSRTLAEVIRNTKMSPELLLKFALLTLRILQMFNQMQ